jgi:hypothetical protein
MKYKIINLETKQEYLLEASNTIEDALDLVDENEDWPKVSDKYWFYYDNNICMHYYDNNNLDQYYKRTNAIFKTRIEAERHKKIFNTIHELVEKYNKIEPLDWGNDQQRKYFLCYDYEESKASLGFCQIGKVPNVLYCTHNYLDELLTKISTDDLDWYTKR